MMGRSSTANTGPTNFAENKITYNALTDHNVECAATARSLHTNLLVNKVAEF